MFLAKDKNNQWVHAHNALIIDEPYRCPECLEMVYIKKGSYKTTHFAHFKKCTQQRFSEGETEEHLKGKQQLYDYLKCENEYVVLEPYLTELKQRPDLLWIKNGKKIALEFQCSPISSQMLQKRTQGYLSRDICVIWIVGKTHHMHKNARFLYCQGVPYYLFFNVDRNTLYRVTQSRMEKITIHDIFNCPELDKHQIFASRVQRLSQTFLRKVYPLRVSIHLAPLRIYAYAARPLGLKNRWSECLILVYSALHTQSCTSLEISQLLQQWMDLQVIECKEMPLLDLSDYVSFLLTICLHTLQKEGLITYVGTTQKWEILNNND